MYSGRSAAILLLRLETLYEVILLDDKKSRSLMHKWGLSFTLAICEKL